MGVTTREGTFALTLVLCATLVACGRSPGPAPKSEAALAFPTPGPPLARGRRTTWRGSWRGFRASPAARWPSWKASRRGRRIAARWTAPGTASHPSGCRRCPPFGRLNWRDCRSVPGRFLSLQRSRRTRDHDFLPFQPGLRDAGAGAGGNTAGIETVLPEKLESHLAAVRDSVSSVFERSFFITREMDKEFRGEVTDGLFTPILLLLARSNHTVLGYRYIRLDESGKIIERAPTTRRRAESATRAWRSTSRRMRTSPCTS